VVCSRRQAFNRLVGEGRSVFDDSNPLPIVGLLFATVGLVGYVVFGWRFGGDSTTAANVLALAAVAVAIGATLWRRRQ
jgi:hypothetical protein